MLMTEEEEEEEGEQIDGNVSREKSDESISPFLSVSFRFQIPIQRRWTNNALRQLCVCTSKMAYALPRVTNSDFRTVNATAWNDNPTMNYEREMKL